MTENTMDLKQSVSARQLDQYWRAANYIAAAQIYLRDNILLRQPLAPDHLKPRLLGHWGTVPGINFVYAHLNRLITTNNCRVLLITGPGHGAPANLANIYLEGSLGARYREYARGADGLGRLIRSFSWPGGFPSHLTPEIPGTIHEGGELGYALATAFGAAFDNSGLIVACIVGDGEAETGPTATAWHSTKYLHPARDGSVLPILHLNEYKIASRTIFGSMNQSELRKLFCGYGYKPIFVNVGQNDSKDELSDHVTMRSAIDEAYHDIMRIRSEWRDTPKVRPAWPMIILQSPKGWTVVDQLAGQPIEGSHRAHQVPIPDPRNEPEQLRALESWLRSYRIDELLDEYGNTKGDWIDVVPDDPLRMGMTPHAAGGALRRSLVRPNWRDFGLTIDSDGRGRKEASDTEVCGRQLRQVIESNRGVFRIACPDEMDSNRLSAVFDTTDRQFVWPILERDANIGPRGSVLEILSEHTCQAWLQGYLLTGRHGLFPCYEAFVSIVDTMMGQYAKFLKRSAEIPWRQPVSSFNYLLSSEGWRQDHNGYSHQMPGFINVLLNKKAEHVRIYLPPDSNCLLSTMDHCLDSTDKINLIIASKQTMPQWLSIEEAADHCRRGISIWDWACGGGSRKSELEPDVVLACAGVYPTAEAIVATRQISNSLADLHLRLVNVTDLLILELDSHHPHGLTENAFARYFGRECPVVFNFHGYPSAVKHLLWHRPNHDRFEINGYREEGTTTTPFTLLADNHVDRFTLIEQVLKVAKRRRPTLGAACDDLTERARLRRDQLLTYAKEKGEDAEEVKDWMLDHQESRL